MFFMDKDASTVRKFSFVLDRLPDYVGDEHTRTDALLPADLDSDL